MVSVKLNSFLYNGIRNYVGLLGRLKKYNERSSASIKLKPNNDATLNRSYNNTEAQNNAINSTLPSPLRVLFFGTDDFSVASLKTLVKNLKYGKPSHICQLDVVCTTKSKVNPVRTFASSQQLRVLDWPPQIRPQEYDVGVVVSFGQLIPEHLIESFQFGMLNVHASLLPRWRGAAPIIYALMNGDTETGITIMQIKPKKFDIGDIVKQERCSISHNELMPGLSTKLSKLGASLLLESLQNLPQSLLESKEQAESGVSYAPRVTSALSRVDWQKMDSMQIFNLSRALHGLYSLTSSWHGQNVKLLEPAVVAHVIEPQPVCLESGHVEFHRQSMTIRVLCRDRQYISFGLIGVAGKRPMKPIDFYNGYISKYDEKERRFS